MLQNSSTISFPLVKFGQIALEYLVSLLLKLNECYECYEFDLQNRVSFEKYSLNIKHIYTIQNSSISGKNDVIVII